MQYETILYEVDDGVLTITLNRPDKLNAQTPTMSYELIAALDRAEADDDVRVVVVTGAGRGFCAGADLSEGAATFDREFLGRESDHSDATAGLETQQDEGGLITLRLYDFLKPVIAAINGAAVGVGVNMTLAMDIRMASENARFGFVFTRRGLVMESASSWFLPRVVPLQQALEWIYRGAIVSAGDALAGGLLRSVHAPEALLPAAHALAREIAENTSPVSLALHRQMLWKTFASQGPMDAHNLDSRGNYYMGQHDAREGIAAFVEKRPAVFPLKVSTGMPPYVPWWPEREFTWLPDVRPE
jgi:enoyl-CoA hydratase/carnithine racemase